MAEVRLLNFKAIENSDEDSRGIQNMAFRIG